MFKLRMGRKFSLALIFGLVATLNDTLGLGMTPETLQLVAILFGVFIGAEGAADAAAALGERWGRDTKKEKEGANGTTPPAPPTPISTA